MTIIPGLLQRYFQCYLTAIQRAVRQGSNLEVCLHALSFEIMNKTAYYKNVRLSHGLTPTSIVPVKGS